MFTKRHFEAIANLIKNSNAETKYELAQDLVELFQEDNDRFSVSKFFKACGITTETETQEETQARLAYEKLGVAIGLQVPKLPILN